MNIVERLRFQEKMEPHRPIFKDGADEIERLRKIAGAICPNCDHALCCEQCGAQVPNDLNG